MTLTLNYYAILREQAGCARETVQTHAVTLAELYEELRSRHGFTLTPDRVRAAVQESYVSLNSPLLDGMTVSFIPPVAGG